MVKYRDNIFLSGSQSGFTIEYVYGVYLSGSLQHLACLKWRFHKNVVNVVMNKCITYEVSLNVKYPWVWMYL